MLLKTCVVTGRTEVQFLAELERLLGDADMTFLRRHPERKRMRWATVSLLDGITVVTVYDRTGFHLATDQWASLLADLEPDEEGGVLETEL